MLETHYFGDKFEMLMTDLASVVTNISNLATNRTKKVIIINVFLSTSKNVHHHKVAYVTVAFTARES